MIKINDILDLINSGIKSHYFKDIITHGVTELIGQNEVDIKRPAIYDGKGDYTFIQEDHSGLIVYHRITDFDNDEDLEGGFGRDSLTTETYTVKTVVLGQQPAIEDDNCEDINLYLAKEFKKLIPRSLSLVDTNRIKVIAINYDKDIIREEEGVEYVPESVLFSLDLEIVIKGIEDCNDLECPVTPFIDCENVTVIDSDGSTNTAVPGSTFTCEPVVQCEDVTVTDSDGTVNEVPSGGSFTCIPLPPTSFNFLGALQFDGLDNYVDFNSTVGMTSNSIMSMWFRPEAITGFLLSKNSNFLNSSLGFSSPTVIGMRVLATGLISFTVANMDKFRWFHLVVTRNGTDAKMYLNGVESTTGTITTTTDTWDFDRIGAGSSLTAFIDLAFDELAMWDSVAGTPANVASLYNNGFGALASDVISNPTVYYRHNETGSATTLVDSSGNNNDGTLNNFPSSGMWVASH